MKALKRRIRRLEQRLAPQPASKGPSAVDILRERRRRRLEAAGQLRRAGAGTSCQRCWQTAERGRHSAPSPQPRPRWKQSRRGDVL